MCDFVYSSLTQYSLGCKICSVSSFPRLFHKKLAKLLLFSKEEMKATHHMCLMPSGFLYNALNELGTKAIAQYLIQQTNVFYLCTLLAVVVLHNVFCL